MAAGQLTATVTVEIAGIAGQLQTGTEELGAEPTGRGDPTDTYELGTGRIGVGTTGVEEIAVGTSGTVGAGPVVIGSLVIGADVVGWLVAVMIGETVKVVVMVEVM